MEHWQSEQAQQAATMQAEIAESRSEAAHLLQQLKSARTELKSSLSDRDTADELQGQLSKTQVDTVLLGVRRHG